MSPNTTETRSIVVDYALPHSPEKVWRAITESALIARWLMPCDFQPVVGHTFSFQTRPAGDWDGKAHCEVLEVDPPRRLSYTFTGGSDSLAGYGHTLNTVVTWTLTATNSGTNLHLEHSGFTSDADLTYQIMSGGWGSMRDRINTVLESL